MCALLAVDVTGAGGPVVLLHGLATDRRIWRLVAPQLARRHTIITLDLPGFGGSAPAGEGFGLEEVAERIARGLAARGVPGPYDLVGHSLGGGIALTLASHRPGSVRRLVLVAPAGLRPLPKGVPRLLAAGAEAGLALRRAAAPLSALRWGRRLLLLGTAADGALLPPSLARQMVGASAGARRTAPALETIAAADLRPLLARLEAPVGAIWGEVDRTVPATACNTITAARPDARVVRLRDTGHVPMLERPEAFVQALELLISNETTLAEGGTTFL